MNRIERALARAVAPLAIAAGLALFPSLALAGGRSAAEPEQQTAGIIITLDAQVSRQLDARDGAGDALDLLADTDVMRDLEDAGVSVEDARTDTEGATLITAEPTGGMSDAEALERSARHRRGRRRAVQLRLPPDRIRRGRRARIPGGRYRKHPGRGSGERPLHPERGLSGKPQPVLGLQHQPG